MFTDDVMQLIFCAESGSKEFLNFVPLLRSSYYCSLFYCHSHPPQRRRNFEVFISQHTTFSPSVFRSQHNSNTPCNVALYMFSLSTFKSSAQTIFYCPVWTCLVWRLPNSFNAFLSTAFDILHWRHQVFKTDIISSVGKAVGPIWSVRWSVMVTVWHIGLFVSVSKFCTTLWLGFIMKPLRWWHRLSSLQAVTIVTGCLTLGLTLSDDVR